MRRILFPLLVIGLSAGLFSLGSGAFFEDSKTHTDNNITAGSLILTLGGDASASCSVANFAPVANVTFDGAGDTCLISATNAGSLPGDLYLEILFSTDRDNSCTAPEQTAETGGCSDPNGDGELDEELLISVCTETASGGSTKTDAGCTGVSLNVTTVAAGLPLACAKVADLAAGGVYSIEVDFKGDTVTNKSQTDTLVTRFNFKLTQDGVAPSGGVCT